jgi:hypothetical protein
MWAALLQSSGIVTQSKQALVALVRKSIACSYSVWRQLRLCRQSSNLESETKSHRQLAMLELALPCLPNLQQAEDTANTVAGSQ